MGVQLPRWVWIGTAALACVAGIVNVVGFLGFQHQAITHLTGNTSLLGAALVAGDDRASLHLLGSIAAFEAGAMQSGLIIQDSTLRLGRRYGVVLTLEAALLFAAVPLFQRHLAAGSLCAAMACGLQNAMATTYSGAVVRTSHLSGMFTDLGIMLGHAMRGMPLARSGPKGGASRSRRRCGRSRRCFRSPDARSSRCARASHSSGTSSTVS